jgi:hypothetical protein
MGIYEVTELNIFLLKGDHVTIPFSTFGVFIYMRLQRKFLRQLQ